MRPETKAYEWPRIIAWVPRSAPHLGQDIVVRTLVVSEVFLDARKGRLKNPAPAENQRLEATSHPSVAVAEWMNHCQVEMRQRGAHHVGHSRFRVLHRLNHVTH